MSHFNTKSLSFYGGAITFVVILFSVVTAYGESHLKAPNKISGRYPIAAQNLPGCLKSDRLLLLMQQSGIYLTGVLVPGDVSEQQAKTAEERPPLKGKLDNQQINLQGPIKSLANCQGQVTIQGKIEQSTLTGTIAQDASEAVSFTAEREAEQPAQKSGH